MLCCWFSPSRESRSSADPSYTSSQAQARPGSFNGPTKGPGSFKVKVKAKVKVKVKARKGRGKAQGDSLVNWVRIISLSKKKIRNPVIYTDVLGD